MKLALYSLVLGFLITFSLLMLTSVSGFESVSNKLLSGPVYVLFWRPWFGLDCANANSIADKLNCAGRLLAMNVLLYSAISFGGLTVFQRLRQVTPNRQVKTKDLS